VLAWPHDPGCAVAHVTKPDAISCSALACAPSAMPLKSIQQYGKTKVSTKRAGEYFDYWVKHFVTCGQQAHYCYRKQSTYLMASMFYE
jgi:hypothetical protein